MKFKFKGRDGMKDLNLAIAGITGLEETLTRGQIVEVPDDHELIPRLRQNGLWEEVIDNPKPAKKTKKVKNGGE
jgi:hypothetical protein